MSVTPLLSSARNQIEALMASIPDYPEPGIMFRDLTPVFADGPAFRAVTDALLEPFGGGFDVIAGIEARGFLLAAAGGYASGKGVMTVRKAGKLPRETHSRSYDLEYGSAVLEVHKDDVPPGSRVLILDDVLATGGTLNATVQLMEMAGLRVVGIGVPLELVGLRGRDRLGQVPVNALLSLD